MERKEIIANLLKNGAKKVSDLVLKNITVTPMPEYVRLGLSLDKEVDAYRQDEEGDYEESKSNIIFVSAYTVSALLKDNEDAAFAANHLLKKPEAFAVILSRAKVDIVQEKVAAGEEYHNPFNNDDTAVVFDHDTIINHLVDIKLSEVGMKRLDRLADIMLGF